MIRALFPGGSITGAPKIRAMEIIDELEPNRRSLYTGAIGYLSRGGSSAFNIAIRTILVEGDRASFQVGGGIVADSDPEAEYEETLAKGRAMYAVLDGQGGSSRLTWWSISPLSRMPQSKREHANEAQGKSHSRPHQGS